MKKIIIVMLIATGIMIYGNKSSELIIPKEAIRFRVIANSDEKVDQDIKLLVRDELQTKITSDLESSDGLATSRKILSSNIDNYKQVVATTLENNNIQEPFSINYGLNYFPEKTYKGVKYQEGNYESLVVTLGSGEGKNWWCVLFPPLCLLEAEEEEEVEEVEYKFFVQELIDKYLK